MLRKRNDAFMRGVAAAYTVAIGIRVIVLDTFDDSAGMNGKKVCTANRRLVLDSQSDVCRSASALGITDLVGKSIGSDETVVSAVKNIAITIIG